MEQHGTCRLTTPLRGLFSFAVLYAAIMGVADAFDGAAWCSRPEVKVGQLMEVVSKYLRDTPEKLDEDASVLILDALWKAFPCKR